MSIITIATTKGGAGKTTLARLILGRATLSGLTAAALDADLNHTLTDWVSTAAKSPITVRHELAPSSADIVEAIKTVNLIKSASQMMRREVITRVVLTAVQPGTNIAEHIEKEVAKAGLPVLRTRLHLLVAFQEMSFTGIPPTSGHAGFQGSNFLDDLEALGGLPEARKLAS